MIYIVPIMGHGTVGKDYIVDNFFANSEFMQSASSKIYYYDTASRAKSVLTEICTKQRTNVTLNESYGSKDDVYRRALVGIIDAFDSLNIRLYDTVDAILEIVTDYYTRFRHTCDNAVIFLNIRDVAFVETLVDKLSGKEYNFVSLIVVDGSTRTPEYKDTPLDCKEYEQSLTGALNEIHIPYFIFKNDDISIENQEEKMHDQANAFFKALTNYFKADNKGGNK